MTERNKVKLQDVADRAGVSAMTVSLALRGGPGSQRMSDDTRARILQVAQELSYSPNARARALRLGKTNVIGLYAGHGFVNVRAPFFSELISGLQEGCELVRKDLLLHGVFHGSSSEDIFRELVDGRIDGLIVTMPRKDPLAKLLADSSFCVVAVADPLQNMPGVVVDDAAGSRMIAEHLHELGHRRTVYVLGTAQPISSQRRRDAFLSVASDMGMEVLIRCLTEETENAAFVDDILSTGATAVVCWNDNVAQWFFEVCRERGVAVPDRLAIVGFDGCPTPFQNPNPLTTIVAPWSDVAREAVLCLDSLIKGEPVPPETVLPVRLVRGNTT
jgi:DNA-binding LacI/PurR family transcriptional regulator